MENVSISPLFDPHFIYPILPLKKGIGLKRLSVEFIHINSGEFDNNVSVLRLQVTTSRSGPSKIAGGRIMESR